jgi:PhoH-like ATPase
MKKNFVLDTSVYLTSAESIYSYGNNDIVVPLKVLEEIDKHKKRQDVVGANARSAIRIFDELREKGNLSEGVRLAKGKGIIKVVSYSEQINKFNLPLALDFGTADHIIMATAIEEKKLTKRKVILVSRDINMRVIANSLGISTEDYIVQNIIVNRDQLYSGLTEKLVDDEFIDQFYEKQEMYLNENLKPNQFVMLISNSNEKKTALARYTNKSEPLKQLIRFDNGRKDVMGIKPKNKEQSFALDLLLDEKVPVVTLVGRAGSGKTLCAIAAGLEQVLDSNTSYNKLIVSRPVQPMGRDIGYLPGNITEKMDPWLKPIQDNLEYLMGYKKEMVEMYIKQGKIEVEALTYIRGRSISNAFICIDEAQNLNAHEIKTIITRVGEGTKIVFTGDIEQIDNVYVNETSNGLAYVVEKFKDFYLAGHVMLNKGERSTVATYAADCL